MAQQCPECQSTVVLQNRGNGKCSNCAGRGTTNTFISDISGTDTKCSKCKGNGRCPRCGGTGQVAGSATVARTTTVKHVEPKPEVTISDLEKAWYGLCDSSKFISEEIGEHFVSRLKAAGKHAAVVVGLSKFTRQTCPKCGEQGQFKIQFLGHLEHPPCGHQWYVGPGSYIGFQFEQIFHTGIRPGGAIKEDADRKDDRAGGWIQGILVFLCVAVFRAVLAVALIPIQAIVSLNQAKYSETPREPAN
jgi:hypothetical protein